MSEWQPIETLRCDGRQVLVAMWHEVGRGWTYEVKRAVEQPYGWEYRIKAWAEIPTPKKEGEDERAS